MSKLQTIGIAMALVATVTEHICWHATNGMPFMTSAAGQAQSPHRGVLEAMSMTAQHFRSFAHLYYFATVKRAATIVLQPCAANRRRPRHANAPLVASNTLQV